MCFICILILVILIVLVFVLVVFVQDIIIIDIVLGKYFVVVGGVLLLQLKNDLFDGVCKVDGGLVFMLSFSYYINDNWVVELWGVVDKFDYCVCGIDGVCLGIVEQQLIVLSGQYYFGQVDNVFCLFVGGGYYEFNFSNEKLVSDVGYIGLEIVKGVIGIVGVDMNINSIWFVCVDVCYMYLCLELIVNGNGIGDKVKLDLWIVGFGIGVCF